jgi:hypothetical protein
LDLPCFGGPAGSPYRVLVEAFHERSADLLIGSSFAKEELADLEIGAPAVF